MIIDYLIDKYDLENKSKDLFINDNSAELEVLEKKWKHKVGERWYGFSLMSNTPINWIKAIDEFLEYIDEETNGEFEIHQIKTKFGGLRFYVQMKKELCQDASVLEQLLTSEDLVY